MIVPHSQLFTSTTSVIAYKFYGKTYILIYLHDTLTCQQRVSHHWATCDILCGWRLKNRSSTVGGIGGTEHGHWLELAAYHHLAPTLFCWWAIHGGTDKIQFWAWFLWWFLQAHWCPCWWSGNLDIGMSFWSWRKARPAGVFQSSYISSLPREDWTVGARARNRSWSEVPIMQHYDPFRLWSCGGTIRPSIYQVDWERLQAPCSQNRPGTPRPLGLWTSCASKEWGWLGGDHQKDRPPSGHSSADSWGAVAFVSRL